STSWKKWPTSSPYPSAWTCRKASTPRSRPPARCRAANIEARHHRLHAREGELMKNAPMIKVLCTMAAALYGCFAASPSRADATATLNIDVNKPGAAIPKTFYGLMTEEINHAYDGGLFAELIQ